MPQSSDKIADLIGSRICHDLISPIGAVANGLELLELSGVPQSPQLSLVAQSASNASARIRLFRLAFGDSSAGQIVSATETGAILDAIYAESRTNVTWQVEGDHPRIDIKMALLAVLCAEQALVTGGTIKITERDGAWHMTAQAPRLAPEPELWAILQNGAADAEVSPSAVQFLLLPELVRRTRREIAVQLTKTSIEMTF